MLVPKLAEESREEISLRTLRQFAGICLFVFGLLFVLSWHRHLGRPTAAGWIAGLFAILLGIPGIISPDLIRPVYMGAVAITRPVGHLVSILMLGMIYYGFMTPLAVIFRFVRRDALMRRRPEVASYWIPRAAPSDLRSYLRQYYKQ
jgi:hypothetical protein